MKKIILLSAILFATVSGAFAQYYNNSPMPKFGIGLSSGFATGLVSNYYPETGGISFNLEYPIKKSNVSLMLSAGYTFYVSGGGYSAGVYGDGYGGGYGVSTDYYGDVASFIPVEAGLKLHITRRFFIEGEAGVSFNVNYYPSDYTGQTTAFIYSPGAGYTFPMFFTRNSTMDLSLNYESRPESGGGYNQVAIKALFNFGF